MAAAAVAAVLDLLGLGWLVRGVLTAGARSELLSLGVEAQLVDKLQLDGSTLEAVMERARAEFKFVAVLLYSSIHEDAAPRLKALLTDELCETLGTRYLVWAGNVCGEEGHRAATRYGARDYPFVGIVHVYSPRKRVLLARREGAVKPGPLRAELTAGMEAAEGMLVAQRADREEAQLRQRLREEQDAALREAAEAEKVVGEEPAEDEEGVARLAITMFDGTRVQRRFLRSDTIAKVAAFVRLHSSYTVGKEFDISTTLPVKVLAPTSTLEDERLYPRAVVVAKEVLTKS